MTPPPIPVSERYERRELLGRGAMGAVHRAYDRVLGHEVALKELHERSPTQLEYLKREFRSLADLSHENLVELYDLVITPNEAFVTMELIDGEDIASHIRRTATRDGNGQRVVDLSLLRVLLDQLVTTLTAIHTEGIVHRDLKPDNVFVDSTGKVRVLDYGLTADIAEGEGATMAGTLPYMAPESAWGKNSFASDWYALGVMVYELATGALPFTQTNVMAMVCAKDDEDYESPDALPNDLRDAITSWLRPAPDDRGDAASWGRASSSGVQKRRSRAPVAFVGREEELKRLKAVLDAPSERPVVVVSGSSGIGKTTLIDHALSQVGAQAIRSRCHPREAIAFNGFDRVATVLSKELSIRVPRELKEADALASVFPAFVDRVVPRDARHLAPDRVVAAADALCELIARRDETVIFIDDAQWLDGDSRRLITALLARDVRATFVFSVREHGRDALLESLEEPIHLPLGPLSTDEAEELMRTLGRDTSDATSHAHGSPFLLVQLGSGEYEIPLGLVVEKRLRELDSDIAREVFELLCVAGKPLGLEVVRDAIAGGPAAIGKLKNQRLLRSLSRGDDLLAPYHDRLAKAYVDTLPAPAVQSRHLSLAEAYLSRENVRSADVVEHLFAAEDRRAYDHALIAGREFEQSHAYDRALSLYRDAFALERGSEACRALADCQSKLGNNLEAASTYREAASLSVGEAKRRLTRRSAEESIRAGHYAEGIDVFRDALANAGVRYTESRPLLLADVARRRMQVTMRGLDYALASKPGGRDDTLDVLHEAATALGPVHPEAGLLFASQLLLSALKSGNARYLAYAFSLEASFVALLGGDKNRARARYLVAETRTLTQEHASDLVPWWHLAECVVSWLEGDWERSARHGRELDGLSDPETFNEFELTSAYYWYLPAVILSGDMERAHSLIQQRHAIAEARNDHFAGNTTRHGYCTLAYLARGDVALAKERADEALSLGKPNVPGYLNWHFHQFLSRAWIALHEGRDEHDYVEEQFALAKKNGYLRLENLALQLRFLRARSLARHALATKKANVARQALSVAKKIKSSGIIPADAWRLAAEASAYRALGDANRADEAKATAKTAFERANMRWHATSAAEPLLFVE